MSTRRARIKAVTSLPPRRKNADIPEIKNKPGQIKDDVEKILKSPRTPRAAVGRDESEKHSSMKFTPVPTQDTNRENAPKTPRRKSPSPLKLPTPISIESPQCPTPKQPEKISVITKTFVSQVAPESPLKPVNTTVYGISPLVSSPKTTINVQRLPTPVRHINIEASEHSKATEKRNDLPDDYNVPSVPESITDDVMDGIIPLQPARSGPKPISFLKNEIISENAEVLFDPIVPLPSPSKVRPKLRPVPRLAPLRRSSIQGSASESEDESRRALLSGGAPTPGPARTRHDSHSLHTPAHTIPPHCIRDVARVRNDSICSSVSQVTTIAPPVTASPLLLKEKLSKSRRQEMSRRMSAMRRRRETAKRDTLTMYDLIFYNPTTNPIVPDQDEINAKEANAKDEAERLKESAVEEAVASPQAAPVPQIKLGPNGEIVLDETSLVINQTDSNRKVSSIVREGAWGGGGGRYRRAPRTADWPPAETVRFYRALAALGTDFTLMAPLFPNRTRKDLKLKFKKEERLNGALIEKALRSATSWDAEGLELEFEEERAEAARRAAQQKEQLIEKKRAERERIKSHRVMGVRGSKGAKALESTMLPGMTNIKHKENEIMTADEIIGRALMNKELGKQKKTSAKVTQQKTPTITQNANQQFATLTLINQSSNEPHKNVSKEMATISRVESLSVPENANVTSVPSNIETGSLVVLTVNDPNSPSKKMLQTYIAHGEGKLTPVAIPPTLLNSVVNYMKKGTPRNNMATSSPQLVSPNSVASADSRLGTPSVIQINPSPVKRQRNSSFSITQL